MGLGSISSEPTSHRIYRPNTLRVSNNNQPLNPGNEAVSCQPCLCCPYGFHIDLDFVRFCESLATGEHLKAKREERRARRLQCNSMEVLLGLTTPTYTLNTSLLPPIIDVPREAEFGASNEPLNSATHSKELNRAVDDFEATLSLSSRHSQSSQISYVVDILSSSTSSSGRDNEGDCSFETKNNNEALQSVRGQMAASLEKLRELEQQVKLIPVLQVKVSVLQEEKRQMAVQLQELKNKFIRGPLKRDIGVCTLSSTLKDGAVQTEQWIKSVKSVSSKFIQTLLHPLVETGTQTFSDFPNIKPSVVKHENQTVQVDLIPKVQEMVLRDHIGTQTEKDTKSVVSHLPKTYRPIVFHRQIQTETTLLEKRHEQHRKSIAIGDGAVNDVLCDRCNNRRTRHASCGTDLVRPATGVNVATQSYSTCQECDARSKSLVAKTVDREMQTTDSCCTSPKMSIRIPRLVECTPSLPIPPPTSHHISESESEDSKDHSEADESDFDSDESVEEEEDVEDAPPMESITPRIRVEPSMEMKAALKVLNDSIHRPSQRGSSKMLVNAIEIVRREWIQVSSTKEADAHSVEDYMDYIETLSMALLERVANLSDNNGNTALHYAVSHSQWDIVSLLLDSKVCFPQLRNKAGYSPPMLAALAQPSNTTEMQVLQRLFSLADVNSKATQHGQTALMLSVSHGRVEVCRLLLASGANVNVQDADGSTALMCAAEHGHTSIVKLLLAQTDIDLHLRDNDGSTALSIAMEAGHKDIGLLIYAHMNFHRSNPSSAASSPVHATARPLTPVKRKASPLPLVQLNS